MITVCVASNHAQIQTLIPLAGLFDGIWWYTARDPELKRWIWQFDFPDLDRAQTFMIRLPDDCIGALSNVIELREQREVERREVEREDDAPSLN